MSEHGGNIQGSATFPGPQNKLYVKSDGLIKAAVRLKP